MGPKGCVSLLFHGIAHESRSMGVGIPIKERPCAGPFRAPRVPINLDSSGGCQQMPVPWHNDRIDNMDDAIRRSDITLLDVGSIHLDIR